MSEAPYPSLADFAAAHKSAHRPVPAWAHPVEPPLGSLTESIDIEDLLDTIVAVQRAEWLHDGVWLGPRTMPEVWRDLVDVARILDVPLPPAVVSPSPSSSQGVTGTDGRAFLHLSTFFLAGVPADERRFALGRACGPIAAHHVTWSTLRALLVDHGGLRAIASKALGPALEIVLGPVSLGARLWLNGWHRASEITANRAGLLACADRHAARKSMLRAALGVRPGVTPDDYLAELDAVRDDSSPGKWAEALQDRPWMHKRMRALDLFARSTLWMDAGHSPLAEPILDADELRTRIDALLQVGR